MKPMPIPIINYQDLISLRNTCLKCKRLMLHAEDRTVYSIDNIATGIRSSHYCRPKQPKFMFKIGSVA